MLELYILMLEHVFFKTQLISVCCLTEHFLELQANEEPGVEDWFQSYGDTCFRKHQNYWFLQIWVFFFWRYNISCAVCTARADSADLHIDMSLFVCLEVFL